MGKEVTPWIGKNCAGKRCASCAAWLRALPVEELRITQREDGSPELELAGIDPYQLSGVKLGKNGVELSFYSRLEAIDRLLELAGPGGDNLLEELGLSGWNGGKDE